MANNHHNHNQPHNNGLLHDNQGSWWEMLSPTQVLTSEQQSETRMMKRKNKCHGNRKLYHFKRKCRARGLNEDEIITLIQQRNRTIYEPVLNGQIIHEQTKQSNKRKRDQSKENLLNNSMKSMSQLSIYEEESKKMKNTKEEVASTDNQSIPLGKIDFNLHKFSKYLKMPRRLLLNSLHLQLNYPLKKKKEQNFILSRLRLFDEQFCLDQIRYLYQVYFDLGSKSHIWPNDILKITQVNEHSLIEKYIQEYLILLRNRIERYTTDLIEQSSSCPLAFLSSLEIIDLRLKEFIRLHHIDLTRTIHYQVNKFKDMIYESNLFQQLSSFHLSLEQHEAINRLTAISKKQLQLFQEMTMFEQRIFSHRLPKSFDSIKAENIDQHSTNERDKFIQDLKRQILNVKLQQYDMKIQEYEHMYEQELATFELEHSKTNSSSLNDPIERHIPMDLLQTYLNQQATGFMRQIRYKESCFHTKLLRHRHSHSSSIKRTTDVYPQVIVDVSKVSLNHNQLDYLSRNGPNYIRPNQSYLHKYERRQKHIKREHNNIMKVVTPYLIRVYRIPSTSTIIKQFSEQLETCLYQRYMAPLSYLNIYRIRKELNLVRSIRYRLKKEKYILRVTDKSGIFHIGHVTDYVNKAEAHRQKTGAYIELATNPLWTVYDKVVHLLNDLRSKNRIRAWQLNKMMPNREKVQLAYLYFVPKPHKAGTPLRPILSSMKTPTTAISKLLDTLIRPIFDKNVRSTTIIDGVDLIRRLQTYAYNGYLKSTTLFCTFDITDLYTMLPQEESLNILMEFLSYYGYQKVKGIPLDAIRKLASIVITENVFIYEKKFYKQIIGGAMGSAFTLTLANIFMWKWEQKLIRAQTASNEIYGRYIDDIFLTSNESLESINAMLDDANKFHPNIKLTRQIGTSLPFLDVFIENQTGILTTSVYRKEAAEPYILPFKSDHPRHVFGNIIDTSLLRAIRYSSTTNLFNIEQQSIKLMLLYNGYPPRYIYARFQQFIRRHTNSLQSSPIQSFFKNENHFQLIRAHLLEQQTTAEKQIQSKINRAKTFNETEKPKHTERQQQPSKQHKWDRCLIVHYTHEARLANNKKDFHEIWNNVVADPDTVNTKLIIGTRNRRNATKEMVSKRSRTPPKSKKPKPGTN